MRIVVVPQFVTVALAVALAGCPDKTEPCHTDADCVEGAYCHQEYLVCFLRDGHEASPSERGKDDDAAVDAQTNPPNAPTGLTAIAGDGWVDLSWTAGGEPDLYKYNLFWGTSARALKQTATISVPETTYSVTGLVSDTIYYFAISAENTAGQRSPLSSVIAVPPYSSDVAPPYVIAWDPPRGESVRVDQRLTITFNERMNTDSVRVNSQAGNYDFGVPQWNTPHNTTVSFPNPPLDFEYNTWYGVSISDGRDAADNGLYPASSVSFRTEPQPEDTSPTVLGASPSDNSVDVPVNSHVSVIFSEPMRVETLPVTAFSLRLANAPATQADIAGHLLWSTPQQSVVSFVPDQPLAPSANYTVTVDRAVQDASGNPLRNAYGFTFRTAAAQDNTPPTVVSTTPGAGARGVTRDADVVVRFSEPMNRLSTQAAFSITQPVGNYALGFAWNSDTEMAVTVPGGFAYGSDVEFVISRQARDLAQNPLANDFTGRFHVVRQRVVRIHSTASLDGVVDDWGNVDLGTSQGQHAVGEVMLQSGGQVFGREHRLFLSFDLSVIAPDSPTEITSAWLFLYRAAVVGGPRGLESGDGIGPLMVDSVSYGDSLSASAFDDPANGICEVGGWPVCSVWWEASMNLPARHGYASWDLSRFVRADWSRTSNPKRSQMRIYFAGAGAFSVSPSPSAIYTTGEHSSLRPYLEVFYEYH